MKNLFKISSLVAIVGLVAFNTYLAGDIFSKGENNLNSFFSSNSAFAETIDGGELPEVTVGFTGNPNVINGCKYWTRNGSVGISVSTDPSISGTIGWTEHLGSKTICMGDNDEYCDYKSCL